MNNYCLFLSCYLTKNSCVINPEISNASGILTKLWVKLVAQHVADTIPDDISHAQFVIMALLLWFEKHEYDITQILIVNWSKLDKMTVSQALKKLVSAGLVQRVEHENDTRAKRPSLTKKGQSLICRLVPLVEKVDAEFFGKITKQDQRELIRILNKLMA